MIINNKRVQGLYIYNSNSESIEFTKNDLVVSGDSIYVCDAESVSGIDPALDTSYEYYHPYPGSMIMSASEYFQYVKNGGDDKYISSQSIMGILQGYQFGLDMEGVVTDWIDKNGDTTLKLSSPTDRALDNLMLTETLNRGMVKVSWELDQIKNGSINDRPFSTLFGFLDKVDADTGLPIDYQLILSQYTYKQTDTLYIRIQEMISPLSGVSVYRYMSWSDGSFPSDGNVISSWRSVFSYSTAIQHKLDALQEYYSTLSSQLSARVNSIIGSFRFKEVYSNSSGTYTKSLTGLADGVYTVCLEGAVDEKKYSESITVRLKTGMTSYDIYPSKLEGYLKLSPGKIELEVTGRTTEFVSVYRREEY